MTTLGTANVPSQDTVNYDALLSTTLNNYVAGKNFFDNIFKDSAFLAYIKNISTLKTQDGGVQISMPLMYGTNGTVKSYSGEEILDTTLQDGMTTAHYPWKEIGGTIGITRLEERQNSGESQIINLLQSKIEQAEMSMREVINTQLLAGTVSSSTFIPGNSAKDLYPLGYFFRKDNTTDPTAGGNVGNISGNTYSWWRHNTAVLNSASADTGNAFALSVTTYAGLKVALHRMFNYCSRGSGGSPDLVVCNQETYETYENALDQQVRYANQRMGDMGFETIKLKGATMVWDEQVPDIDTGTLAASATTGSAFFINTKFYKLVMDSMTDMIVTPFVEPENQSVKTAKILAMLNATVSNMRKHGVCYAISKSITS